MKKYIKILFFTLLSVIVLAVSAAAVSVTYDISRNTGLDGVYDITATIRDDSVNEGFRAFKNTVVFDTDIFVPVDANNGQAISLSGTNSQPFVLASQDIEFAPGAPVWATNENICTLDYEVYTENFCDASEFEVFTMTVKLADDLLITTIPADSFNASTIVYANGNILCYGVDGETDGITVVNNVQPKSSIKLSVDANSTVYHQDGTTEYVKNASEVDVIAEDGVVVVNTGYTAQKFYVIDAKQKTATKVDALDDALLTSENAGIRATGDQGIRFKSSIFTPALALDDYRIVRYGHIATAESSKTGLTEGNYTLNLALVNSGKAIKGEAYNRAEGKNVVFDFDEENQRTIFTGVMTNIPVKDYETPIVFRAYYELSDGTVVYTPETRVSVYLIAKAIKVAGGSAYTENQEFIDSIVDPIDEKHEQEELEKNTVWVDISELFKD